MKTVSLSGISSVRHLRGFALGLMFLGITITSGPTTAHIDPPIDPPLLTEVDLATLTFLTDWDDGTDGTAELVLLYTVHWGGDHGGTVYMWSKDHNFDTIAPPYTAVPPRLVMGTHTECSPAAAPDGYRQGLRKRFRTRFLREYLGFCGRGGCRRSSRDVSRSGIRDCGGGRGGRSSRRRVTRPRRKLL